MRKKLGGELLEGGAENGEKLLLGDGGSRSAVGEKSIDLRAY